jgi:hypothetical protein
VGKRKSRPRLASAAFFAVAAGSIIFPLFSVSCELEGQEITRASFTGRGLAVGSRESIDTSLAQSMGIFEEDLDELVPDRPPEPLVIVAIAAAAAGVVLSFFSGRRLLGGLSGLGGLACLLALWGKAVGETAGFNRALAWYLAEPTGDMLPTFRLSVLPAFWIAAAALGVATAAELRPYLLPPRIPSDHEASSEKDTGGQTATDNNGSDRG